MNFNKHFDLKGKHAFLGASSSHWLKYTKEKLEQVYRSNLAKLNGTELHELAATCIEKGVRLEDNQTTLSMYVNDSIGYCMTPEQVLFYSYNCFGTADAISFRQEGKSKKKTLRIHDLKTGEAPTHMEQLMIYAALFCLEYKVDPKSIDIHLCIYQCDELHPYDPTGDEIFDIMKKIVESDTVINEIKKEGALL